jgi:hypothetical protein
MWNILSILWWIIVRLLWVMGALVLITILGALKDSFRSKSTPSHLLASAVHRPAASAVTDIAKRGAPAAPGKVPSATSIFEFLENYRYLVSPAPNHEHEGLLDDVSEEKEENVAPEEDSLASMESPAGSIKNNTLQVQSEKGHVRRRSWNETLKKRNVDSPSASTSSNSPPSLLPGDLNNASSMNKSSSGLVESQLEEKKSPHSNSGLHLVITEPAISEQTSLIPPPQLSSQSAFSVLQREVKELLESSAPNDSVFDLLRSRIIEERTAKRIQQFEFDLLNSRLMSHPSWKLRDVNERKSDGLSTIADTLDDSRRGSSKSQITHLLYEFPTSSEELLKKSKIHRESAFEQQAQKVL